MMRCSMSRARIADLRRLVAAADMPERARARQLAVLDQMEAEWFEEVYRRWQRRRYAPLAAARQAAADAVAAVASALRAALEDER
jgi:hypothetical protein